MTDQDRKLIMKRQKACNPFTAAHCPLQSTSGPDPEMIQDELSIQVAGVRSVLICVAPAAWIAEMCFMHQLHQLHQLHVPTNISPSWIFRKLGARLGSSGRHRQTQMKAVPVLRQRSRWLWQRSVQYLATECCKTCKTKVLQKHFAKHGMLSASGKHAMIACKTWLKTC